MSDESPGRREKVPEEAVEFFANAFNENLRAIRRAQIAAGERLETQRIEANQRLHTQRLENDRVATKGKNFIAGLLILVVGTLSFAMIRIGKPEMATELLVKLIIFAGGLGVGYGMGKVSGKRES